MTVHVTPKGEGWQVKQAGGKKATAVVKTQAEAIKIASQQKSNAKTTVMIHGTDGKVRASQKASGIKKAAAKTTRTKTAKTTKGKK